MEASPSRWKLLWRNVAFYKPLEGPWRRRNVLRRDGTFYTATEGSTPRRNGLRRNGRFYAVPERSLPRRKVLRRNGTFYATTERSTLRRKVPGRNGTFQVAAEGSTPQRNLLHRKARFHSGREAYRPLENGTEGRRCFFRLGSLGSTTGSGAPELFDSWKDTCRSWYPAFRLSGCITVLHTCRGQPCGPAGVLALQASSSKRLGREGFQGFEHE
jgi:hypothetical protein